MSNTSTHSSKSMDELRNLINELDDTIISSIAKRHQVAMQIGMYKEQNGLAVYDKNREDQLHAYHAKLSEKYNVGEDFVHDIFSLIIEQSKALQQKGSK